MRYLNSDFEKWYENYIVDLDRVNPPHRQDIARDAYLVATEDAAKLLDAESEAAGKAGCNAERDTLAGIAAAIRGKNDSHSEH